MKIIGAGFGRTGTMSTRLALKDLGYDPVYHMSEIMKPPKYLMDLAKLFGKILGQKPTNLVRMGDGGMHHCDLLIKAMEAKQNGEKEVCFKYLKTVFKNYDSCLDFPACMFYEELHELYPDALVLLNVRDNPEDFAKSVINTIGSFHVYLNTSQHTTAAKFFGPIGVIANEMVTKVISEPMGLNSESDWVDKEVLVECYEKHVAEVKSKIPEEKLLVFNVKQGWKPICEKLGVKMPDHDFPRGNDTNQLKFLTGMVQKLDVVVLVVVSALLLVSFYFIFMFLANLMN